MKFGKCKDKFKGEFLHMRNFAFPSSRAKVERQRPVKVDESICIKRSSRLAKLSKAISLSQILSVCNNNPIKPNKLIKPVSVSFFNTQFESKKREIRSSSGDRKTSRKFAHLLKMTERNPKPNFPQQPEVKHYSQLESRISEPDSTIHSSPSTKKKIKVQAWVPQAIMFNN